MLRSMAVGLVAIVCLVAVFAASSEALEGRAGEVIKTVEDLKDLQAKGLLTEAQVIVYGELIDLGYCIPIVETTDRSPEVAIGKNFWKATQMNKGKASVGSEDEILNYAGQGLPFPYVAPDDPQAGLKAAWNYDLRYEGDDNAWEGWLYYLTDGKGNVKGLAGNSYKVRFNWRTDIPPTPRLYPDSFGEVHFKELVGFLKPFASKGLYQVTVKYTDPKRLRDSWVYVPGLRRSTRVGAGNRCDCLGGFTFNMDDSDNWTGDTALFKWKLLRVEDHLVNSLRDINEIYAGKAYIKGAHELLTLLERRKVWVIEQTPKFEGYCYSKRHYYYDPEMWRFVWVEMYDRAGGLWKCLNQQFILYPTPEQYGGGAILVNVCGGCTDFRIWEGGPYHHTSIRNDLDLSPDTFTLDSIRRRGR